MTLVLLSDLVAPVTETDALAQELTIAQTVGLPTTAWQPLDIDRSVLAVNATMISEYSSTINLLAQGGYASYAALMVDATGQSITTWMDLRAKDQYNIERLPATYAIGNVPVVNASGSTYPYSDNTPLHFQNGTTGATYTSVGSGSVSPGANLVPVTADATWIGRSGTSGSGVTLILSTPLSGVTVSALTISLVGSDAETNAALLVRGQGKIAAISPNGAAQAYYFVATSIPQGTPSTVPPYAVSAVITRAKPQTNPGSGIVSLIIANAAGAPPSGDVDVVNAAIQATVVPSSVKAVVSAADPVNVTISFDVFIKTSSGLTAAQALTNIDDALANLFASLPIGGYNSGIAGFLNYIPLALVADVLMNANIGTIDVFIPPFVGSGLSPQPALAANQVGVYLAGTQLVTFV